MGNLQDISSIPISLIYVLVIWSLIWKGFGLWRASKNNSPAWFIAILILNTLGILEILYLFVFSKLGRKEKAKA